MSENNRQGGSMPMPPEVKSSNQVSTDDKEVEVQIGAAEPHSTVEVKEEPKKKSVIKVKALRKGFYGNLRRKLGDKFAIKGKSDWGTWMECEDKGLQKELVAEHKKKMKKIREN